MLGAQLCRSIRLSLQPGGISPDELTNGFITGIRIHPGEPVANQVAEFLNIFMIALFSQGARITVLRTAAQHQRREEILPALQQIIQLPHIGFPVEQFQGLTYPFRRTFFLEKL